MLQCQAQVAIYVDHQVTRPRRMLRARVTSVLYTMGVVERLLVTAKGFVLPCPTLSLHLQ
jgi:hypothetical protein